MTVAYDIAFPSTGGDEWFGHVGTTPPTVMRGTRKFITCALMAGYAATSTLSTVTPANAAALNAITAQPSTLPALLAAQPAPPLDRECCSRHAPEASPPVRAQLGRDRPGGRRLAAHHP